jgi:septum formation protein
MESVQTGKRYEGRTCIKITEKEGTLSLLFNDFDIRASDADEDIGFTEPGEYVEKLAHKKAEAVESSEGELIIAADTIVFVDGRILGKPASEEEAGNMIHMLSGRKHSVYTGVSMSFLGRKIVFHEKTDVYFRYISVDEIREYLKKASYMDKAGAYAIQQHAVRFVERIDGDYNNVVGLPVFRISEKLKLLGIYV